MAAEATEREGVAELVHKQRDSGDRGNGDLIGELTRGARDEIHRNEKEEFDANRIRRPWFASTGRLRRETHREDDDTADQRREDGESGTKRMRTRDAAHAFSS